MPMSNAPNGTNHPAGRPPAPPATPGQPPFRPQRAVRGLLWSAGSDAGQARKPVNQDAYGCYEPADPRLLPTKGLLYIVADGMGGYAGGQQASRIAVEQMAYAYYADPSEDVRASLVRAVEAAHQAIRQFAAQNPALTGMGTTVVAAVVRGEELEVVNLGDSRAYLLRGRELRQLSQDHSWVAEEVAAGHISPQQARQHQLRNVVTRSLGADKPPQPYLVAERLHVGDTLLLCSDGLHGVLEDAEIQHTVSTSAPRAGVEQLIRQANQAGGPDNITAAIVRAAGAGPAGGRKLPFGLSPTRLFWISGGLLALVLLIMFIVLTARLIAPGQKQEKSPSPTARATPSATVATPTTVTPSLTMESPQPARARVGLLTICSDASYPEHPSLDRLVYYLGGPPEGGDSPCRNTIMENYPNAFEGGDPNKMASVNFRVDPCQRGLRVLLVGQVEKKGAPGEYVLLVNGQSYAIHGVTGIEKDDWVRLIGGVEADSRGRNDYKINQVYAMDRWKEGNWQQAASPQLEGLPPCGDWRVGNDSIWIYTQAVPAVWRMMTPIQVEQQLEQYQEQYVLLRACRSSGDQEQYLRLDLEAIYLWNEGAQIYERQWGILWNNIDEEKNRCP